MLLLLRLRYFLRAALQTGHLTTQCTTYCWNRWQFSWRFKELQTMWWVSSLWPWFSWVEKNKFFFFYSDLWLVNCCLIGQVKFIFIPVGCQLSSTRETEMFGTEGRMDEATVDDVIRPFLEKIIKHYIFSLEIFRSRDLRTPNVCLCVCLSVCLCVCHKRFKELIN